MTGIYFSGTGNTRYCIKRFLEKLGADGRAFPIEDAAAAQAITKDNEIVFAYPVYYSNIPKIIRDFIEENKTLWQGKRIFIIATMGLFSGDGAGVSARLFKKYGAEISGGLHLKMPDCIGDVGLLKKSPDDNREIIKQAAQKTDNAAERYRNGKPPREGLSVFHLIAGLFGQRLWFGGKVKDYANLPKIDGEKCIGCGACERLCPMGNIKFEDGRALSGNRCTMCYRCFSECPKQAITLIGKRVTVQYKLDDRTIDLLGNWRGAV